ncbi:hypothetical protein Tco_0074562, partial [Tanacetum coccineum]
DGIGRGCVSSFTLEMQVTLHNEIKQKFSLYKGGGVLRKLEAFVTSPIGCGGSDVGLA